MRPTKDHAWVTTRRHVARATGRAADSCDLDSPQESKRAHDAAPSCQPFSYKLPGDSDRRQECQRAADRIFTKVDSYAHELRARVVGHSALSPMDFEEKPRQAGEKIFCGALEPDPTRAARPMLGCCESRTPLKRLYLCDSGAYPGSGVAGIPGHHAVREILRDRLKSVRGPNR